MSGDQLDGPLSALVGSCAWRLNAESQPETANMSGLETPGKNVGRRWLFHDIFARDRQLFVLVPQYQRVGIRAEEIMPKVRAARAGSRWHMLLHREVSPSMPQHQSTRNAWGIIRWKLPPDVGINEFIEVAIDYVRDAHVRRVWHADMLGSQLSAQQALRRRSREAVSIHRGVHSEAPVDCITHPGWNCMWPRLQVRKPNSGAGSTMSGASLEPESQPHSNEETAVDPRPYSLMATTMMLLEDKERYMASWAAFHADRGVEAVVAYRNDDEWLQGICLLVEATQFYCEGIQLDDARQAPVDPSTDF